MAISHQQVYFEQDKTWSWCLSDACQAKQIVLVSKVLVWAYNMHRQKEEAYGNKNQICHFAFEFEPLLRYGPRWVSYMTMKCTECKTRHKFEVIPPFLWFAGWHHSPLLWHPSPFSAVRHRAGSPFLNSARRPVPILGSANRTGGLPTWCSSSSRSSSHSSSSGSSSSSSSSSK